MDPISLVMAGLGLAGGIAGSVMSSEKAVDAEKKMREQEAFNRSLYSQQYYQDILNRSDTQNMLRKLRDGLKKNSKQIENAAVVSGATPEAVAAAKSDNAQAYADAIANIAASDSQRKDAALANYQNMQNSTYSNWVNTYNQYASNWTNFASQAFGAGAQALQGMDWDAGGATKPSGGSGLLESQYNKPYF